MEQKYSFVSFLAQKYPFVKILQKKILPLMKNDTMHAMWKKAPHGQQVPHDHPLGFSFKDPKGFLLGY